MIFGEGFECDVICVEVLWLNVVYCVYLLGFVVELVKVVGLFDMFVLLLDSE